MRSNSANPWSNSRIAALLRLGDTLYATHYVCPGIGDMLLNDELNAFMNNTSRIRGVRKAFFFAGESYEDILAELDKTSGKEPGRYVSYGDASDAAVDNDLGMQECGADIVVGMDDPDLPPR